LNILFPIPRYSRSKVLDFPPFPIMIPPRHAKSHSRTALVSSQNGSVSDRNDVRAKSVRGWLHVCDFMCDLLQFAANRICDLLRLRFGVRLGIATVYTYHAIRYAIWCAQRQRQRTDTESHTKSHLRFGTKKS
jgi:hypothetical protein